MFGKTRGPKRAYRIYFATDIHGSDRCFRKFLAAAKVYEADALILGGDIAGKAIVPIVDGGDGRYRCTFQGVEISASEAELEAIREKIAFNGLYPYVCDAQERARLSEDPEHQHEMFERLIRDQINSWLEMAAARLAPDVACVITPGNDDPRSVDHVLESASRVDCPERSLLVLGPIVLASLGNTNRTPWDTDREYDEAELAAQIDEMLDGRPEDKGLVFNFHCPPYDSGLDTVPKLDEDLKPVVARGVPVEEPVGSTAVKAAIECYEPAVGLHGHIHESHGAIKIGVTTCINPGSEYGSGWLKGAIVDFGPKGEYVSHLLTSG